MTDTRSHFTDRTVLVTGAARGIGQAIARAFCAAGARVALADIDPDRGEETTSALVADGGKAAFHQVDVTRPGEVEALIARIVSDYGGLDIAVNNAGIEGLPLRTADATEEQFDQLMAVNVKGVWLCMKHEIAAMAERGGGRIVNMASVAGLVGAHSLPLYAATKHAVVGLTRSAALEYARKGIRVNAVCPAVIRTAMYERAMEAHPEWVEAVERNNPSRRLGEVDEVARAVLWLASDGASFVNGAALPVDGGLTAQ